MEEIIELFFLIEFKSARVYEVQILMVMKELRLRFTRKFFFVKQSLWRDSSASNVSVCCSKKDAIF